MRILDILRRLLVLGAVVLTAITALAATPAAARVFVGIGLGFPVFAPYPYYPYYPYYYAPPAAYYPPYYAAPTVVAQPAAPAPAQSWYYCDNPKGYYPYLQSCGSGWRQVPATPPGPTQ
ncbi:MAG TPA: hypothetical protein VN980_11430 [Alphaproteobacteria bacterium]|nr:hypothetical protein [Alphaproteobacteria bacterium]